MAQDELREVEALEWAEATVRDVSEAFTALPALRKPPVYTPQPRVRTPEEGIEGLFATGTRCQFTNHLPKDPVLMRLGEDGRNFSGD